MEWLSEPAKTLPGEIIRGTRGRGVFTLQYSRWAMVTRIDYLGYTLCRAGQTCGARASG